MHFFVECGDRLDVGVPAVLFPQFLDSLSNSADRFSAGVGEGVVLAILPTIPGTTNDVLVLDRAGTQERDTVLRPGQGALDIL